MRLAILPRAVSVVAAGERADWRLQTTRWLVWRGRKRTNGAGVNGENAAFVNLRMV